MKGYTTSDIAEMLGVEAVTVRKYALALEKFGYIVERDAGDRRVYSERDAMAFQQLKALRERSGMSVDNAATVITMRYNEASENVSLSVSDQNSPDVQHYLDRYAEASEARMIELLQRNQQEIAATFEQVILDDRNRRLDDHFVQKRVERQLRAKGLDLWERKPESERFQKVGWFKKEENAVARDRFVQQYLDEHYEEQLLEAYNGEKDNR